MILLTWSSEYMLLAEYLSHKII